MTLEYLMQAIGEIAIHNNLVGWYGAGGSVYAVNAENVKEYPLLFMSPTGDHLVRENTTRYTVTIFYMDRLFDDDANATQVTSNGIETLKNLYRQIPQIEWVTDVQEEPRVRIFGETEKMNDRVAGAYMTLWIDVLNPSVCPVYFDEYGYPIGNWLPPVVTTNVLDNLASKNWVYQIIGDLNNIDPSVIEALVTSLANYTETRNFATINGDVITNGGDIILVTPEQLQDAKDEMDGKITDIRGDVHDLDVRVTELENQSVDWVTQQELQDAKDDLQDQIDAIDLTPFATHTEVQTVDGKVDALDDRVDGIEDRVDDLEDAIPTLATKQDAQDLQDQIDAIDLTPFATKTELQTAEDNLQDGIDALGQSKQDKLTAGNYITINGNEIAVEDIYYIDSAGAWPLVNQILERIEATYGGSHVMVLFNNNGRPLLFTECYAFNQQTKQALYKTVNEEGGKLMKYTLTLNYNDPVTAATVTSEVFIDPADILSRINAKQDALTPGSGISIQNNVISATAVGIQSAPGSPNQITCIWSGSQSAYEAIGAGNYHNDWLYFIDRT